MTSNKIARGGGDGGFKPSKERQEIDMERTCIDCAGLSLGYPGHVSSDECKRIGITFFYHQKKSFMVPTRVFRIFEHARKEPQFSSQDVVLSLEFGKAGRSEETIVAALAPFDRRNDFGENVDGKGKPVVGRVDALPGPRFAGGEASADQNVEKAFDRSATTYEHF